MTRLHYLTADAVEDFRRDVSKHLDWYYSPEGSFPGDLAADAVRDAQFDAEALAELLNLGDYRHDAENALAVYEALPDLSPQQASDERFWVHVGHFECAQYIADRWLGKRPPDADRAAQRVRNHFFARDARGLIRDCGISRLWWLGRIAHQVDGDAAGLFLEIVLHRQDVRSALIERPSMSLNLTVLREIFGVMRSHWESGSRREQAPLFARNPFRAWMRGLNRRGGVVLLDALPPAELRKILRDEADRAIELNVNGGQPQS